MTVGHDIDTLVDTEAGITSRELFVNWKTVAEYFAGDLYHEVSHQSANLAEIGLGSGRRRRDGRST